MTKFIFLLLTLCTTLSATTIDRTLKSIDYRSQNGNTIVLITLSDDSIWKWLPDHYSENLLRKWNEGDPIIIQPANHPGFLLQNQVKPLFIPTVALSYHSYLIYPSLKDYDKESDMITLSDGTQWELIFDFNKRTLHHWAKDDRIIPIIGARGNCELLNIDVPFENRNQIERCVEVLPLTEISLEEEALLVQQEQILEEEPEDTL